MCLLGLLRRRRLPRFGPAPNGPHTAAALMSLPYNREGRASVVRWLLWESGMPALEHSPQGALALHYAAARGCLDCTKLLVDASTGLTANTQMENDVTPVYLAAQEGHLDVLKFLVLEAGGSLYIRAKDGMAPVHAAAQMGCLPCLKWMIEDQGVDVDLRDGDGATALHFAASRGHVDCVRWLLRHGATLVLDKYGKSPINDAAENQQMECLNVLVQHGTTPDYHEEARYHGKLHGCTCRTADPTTRCSYADCVNYPQEPFYLHSPGKEGLIGGKDGIYINPMVESGTDPFYLHKPGEVPYHRVKQLFQQPQQPTHIPNLTVKVEVHSVGGEHDYEDIYLQDSGKHSRCPSVSSTNSNAVVHDTATHSPESGMSSASPSDLGHSEEENEKAKINANQINQTHSLPHPTNNSRMLKRVVSEPGNMVPPPPPPPPAEEAAQGSSPVPASPPMTVEPPPSPPMTSEQSSARSTISEPAPSRLMTVEEVPSIPVAVAKEEPPTPPPSEEPSTPTLQRSPSVVSGGTETSTVEQCSSHSEVSSSHVGHLVGKQMVLPFIPPKFSGNDPNALIKPSEYLKSLSGNGASPTATTAPNNNAVPPPPPPVIPPPPPPAPAPPDPPKPPPQPLSTISIHDLHSVQLRRTKAPAAKTMSCPPRSLSGIGEQPFQAQKEDLIAELKMSKDITGIKKMKVERVKIEEKQEKEMVSELSRQFSIEHFVEKQMPEKDSAGNPIPPWKRQMLAKKAADKARKEAEDRLAKEAEERRLQAIPAWKRHLLQSKKQDEPPIKVSTIPPPPPPTAANTTTVVVIEEKKPAEEKKVENKENNKPEPVKSEPSGADEPQIIPWRAQLRKTNSTLNLLE